jgi:hypothetical protein
MEADEWNSLQEKKNDIDFFCRPMTAPGVGCFYLSCAAVDCCCHNFLCASCRPTRLNGHSTRLKGRIAPFDLNCVDISIFF